MCVLLWSTSVKEEDLLSWCSFIVEDSRCPVEWLAGGQAVTGLAEGAASQPATLTLSPSTPHQLTSQVRDGRGRQRRREGGRGATEGDTWLLYMWGMRGGG